MTSDGKSDADQMAPGLVSLLDSLDQAVIVQDASGRIQLLNAVAQLWFPDLEVGKEFDQKGDTFVAKPAGFRVCGRLRRLVDEWQAWVITEVPGELTENRADEATRRREFLLLAGRELTAGVGRDTAAESLVRMSVPLLGERAALMLPAPRARVSWWRFGPGETTVTSGIARAPAPRTAPVLAAALRDSAVRDSAVRDSAVRDSAVRDSSGTTLTVPARELAALSAVLGVELTGAEPVVATPLRGPDRIEGLLVMVRPGPAELLASLAALAGPVLAAARRARDQAAALSVLQAPLLPAGPDDLPALPGAQFGVAHWPSAGELAVGGDFYLVRPIAGGAVFGLGDVCGKGAEALAESGRVQHSLNALMLLERDPTKLLYLLNRALLAGGRTVFTTMVLGELASTRSGLRLTLATGGHPPPIVLRKSGHVEEIAVPGTVVGILPEARFGKMTVTLAPGETCVLYSDGVTEAGRRTGQAEEQFGPERLVTCLRGCAEMTAQAVASHLERTVRDWLGRNDHDDLAVLAVRAVQPDTRAAVMD